MLSGRCGSCWLQSGSEARRAPQRTRPCSSSQAPQRGMMGNVDRGMAFGSEAERLIRIRRRGTRDRVRGGTPLLVEEGRGWCPPFRLLGRIDVLLLLLQQVLAEGKNVVFIPGGFG